METANITVGKLKKLLDEYHDDTIILLSHDEEGNGFGKLYTVEEYLVHGEGYDLTIITEDDIENEEYDDDFIEEAYRALILWP